jgi:hypothetical protein
MKTLLFVSFFVTNLAFANITEITGSFETTQSHAKAYDDQGMFYASFAPAKDSREPASVIQNEKVREEHVTEIGGSF